MKPLSLQKTSTVRDAAAFYHRHMMPSDVLCPLGSRLVLKPGHFFSLVSRRTDGATKGWVSSANSLEHAFELIEAGKIDVPHIAGCDYQRIHDLPLLLDVIAWPHLVAKNCEGKRVYVKRYESPKPKPRIKVAVTYLVDGHLRPASFHTTDLDVRWLRKSAPEILWKKNEG